MKKIFILFTILLWAAVSALAQQKISISGIVTDENKEPIIGANVSVKDVPGLGTITDINGRYIIKVEPYNRLVFSYIGYRSQEILIKDQTTVNIVLKEDVTNAIDEVVITGTGVRHCKCSDQCCRFNRSSFISAYYMDLVLKTTNRIFCNNDDISQFRSKCFL